MMLVKVNFVLLILVAVISGNEESSFATCGEENSEDVISAIMSTAERLMELRFPTWGWSNTPGVVLGLQLSAQAEFFGRDKAVEEMEIEVKTDLESMSIGKLALYVLAAKAACADPRKFAGRNLVDILDERSKQQFRYNGSSKQLIPSDGYYQFGLTLGALCVSGHPAKNWTVQRILKGQQPDGSFGDFHSVDDAAQVLLALSCIKTENRPRWLKNLVNQSTLNLVKFLKSSVRTDDGNVWIGNKYSSPASALGLMEADEGSSEEWRCRDVMKGLAIQPEPLGQEGAFYQRLPALAGVSYLKLLDKNWECQDTVPIPDGYEPICDPKEPSTCNPVEPTAPSQSMIEVRLIVYTIPPPSVGGIPNANITVKVRNGSTLLEAMIVARDDGQITFDSVPTAWGQSITSLQGFEADSEAREFWSLINASTQDSLPKGVSGYVLTDGEQIEFRIKTW